MEKREFTLQGHEWRKYKTRDGRDAKIVYSEFKSKAERITLMGVIKTKEGHDMIGTWKENGAWEYEESKEGHDFDLFDVPDQKEPESHYIYYDVKGKNIYPIFVQTSMTKKDAGVSNRIKVYLEENRWDE